MKIVSPSLIITFLVNFAACGQVVWNSTYQVGIGHARSTKRGDIVCARYNPRGAHGAPEMFKENIFPKGGSKLKKLKLNNFLIEGLTIETSAFRIPVCWASYITKYVDKIKFLFCT